MFDHTPLTLTVAFLLGVIATARCVRLVTSDDWPPVSSVRMAWLTWTSNGSEWRRDWADLLTCPFCFAPYATAGNLLLAYVSDVAPWWFLLNLWAAVSYLTAMVVARDEPPAE